LFTTEAFVDATFRLGCGYLRLGHKLTLADLF
jgi:hypothetical protein